MSIHVLPNQGRYGNQLFLYFLSRILSLHLNYKVFGCDYHELKYDFSQKDQFNYSEPIEEITDDTLKNLNDFENIIKNQNPRKLLLNGYFQIKEIYFQYKELIKKWFDLPKFNIPKDHTAIHLRLGDLLTVHHAHHLLPMEYYEHALQMYPFSQLNICTDTPNHEVVFYLMKKYNAKIFIENEKNTKSFLESHNNLILSQVTFSFWSGFFCDGENIINAIPKTGWNSGLEANPNLLVTNDIRYKNIKL
jgi:hypothetical protein